jgi:hypothetical protein
VDVIRSAPELLMQRSRAGRRASEFVNPARSRSISDLTGDRTLARLSSRSATRCCFIAMKLSLQDADPFPQGPQIFNVKRQSSNAAIQIHGLPQSNLCLLRAAGHARIAGKVEQYYNIPGMNLARLKQDCLRSLESFASPDRIGHLNPPRRVLWHNLHKVTGEVCGQSPFPGRNVESQARSQDFDAGLVRERDLIERKRRIVQHPQLEIPARGKDTPLPIAVQGIGDSCWKAKGALVAAQMSNGKAPGASLERSRATSTTNSCPKVLLINFRYQQAVGPGKPSGISRKPARAKRASRPIRQLPD